MTTEIRLFTWTTHALGYGWKNLDDTADLSETLSSVSGGAATYMDVGIRVFRRTTGGVENEITDPALDPVAVVRFYSSDTTPVLRSADWACPLTSLSSEYVVVKIYRKFEGASTWSIWSMKWVTPESTWSSLDAATWHVEYKGGYGGSMFRLYFGLTTSSHIDNFQYTVGAAPPTIKGIKVQVI
jgi:hypothetical protein